MEALVAAVIFTIAVAGVFASLSAVKEPTAESDIAVRAAQCGQQVLETLRARVDARDWSSSPDLTVGTYNLSGAELDPFPQCSGYTVDYEVTDAGNSVRKVVAQVNW